MDISQEFEPQASVSRASEHLREHGVPGADEGVFELDVEEEVLDLTATDEVLDLAVEFAEFEPEPAAAASFDTEKAATLAAWAKLRNGRDTPSIEEAYSQSSSFFTPLSAVFDLTEESELPGLSYLGDELATMCGFDPAGPLPESWTTCDLLDRLHDRCGDTVAARAPTDFELSWPASSGRLGSARGFMLPFSYSGVRINQVLAIILADPMNTAETDELWNEQMNAQNAKKDELLLDHELDPSEGPKLAEQPAASPYFLVSLPDSDRPTRPLQANGLLPTVSVASEIVPITQAAYDTLEKRLAQARNLAKAASASEDRSHNALYEAIGCAYDFAIASTQAPDELARLLEAADITMQNRAPMTPLVKLVFGAEYDKTRLAEYAAALSHAYRIGLGRGELSPFLRTAEGGLKAVVKQERKLRNAERDKAKPAKTGPRPGLAKKLRAMPTQPLANLSGEGDEFTLVLARRMPDGHAVMVGEVPRDLALLERAARKIADGPD